MDAYHQQRRFAGSGDAPPPPQQPPHPSHPNAHWYPAPPPPYPPHPGHPYPPQHHHQWGPPPDLQHQRHPPPPQQQHYGYQQPPPPMPMQQQQPPPPGNPWPPHHAAGQPPPPSYPPPPPGQAWTNHSWAQNHGYPGQQRETNHLLDRGPMVSPAQTFGSFPSTYEQEVSYNYSSAPGNGNNMLQYPSSQGQSFSTASTVQGGFPQAPLTELPPVGHERQSVDPSDQPLEFNSRKAPDVAVHTNVNSTIPAAPTLGTNYDTVATSTHSWTPSATVGFLPRAPLPPQAAQMDPHAAPLFGAASSSNYAPPAAFGVGSVTEVFPTDPNTPFSVAEKSKKRPVPNWLREELLKKKSAPLSASAQHPTNLNSTESDNAEEPLGKPGQSDSRSNDSAKSTEDNEDDEDEIEATRMAAINQEIKRVLTEVLLKVTDDLFDEIATKVLNEDDSSAEANGPTDVSGSKEPGLGVSRTRTSAKVVLPAKPANISSSDHKGSTGLSSPKGALLGLASYDSDDDDDDDNGGDGKDKIPMSGLSANAGAANAEEGDKSNIGKQRVNQNEKVSSLGKSTQMSTSAEPEQVHIHDTQNGEFPLDAKTFIEPKGAVDKMDDKAHRYAAVDIQNRKTSSGSNTEKYNDLESSHRHLERSSKEDLVKEVQTDDTKELESSTAEKYNNDKYGTYGNVDKKSSFKEGKGSGRIAKHESDRREPHSRGNSKHDGAKEDRKDFPKDTRERDRDTTDRRGGKGKDEKDERSRQMTKRSTNHSRSSRSRSPRGRSRTRKENSSHVRGSVSSDEPSDSVKKRKHHSRKNSLSPSPPKSRNRRVSRSPHSKHSHRRHSPYSSANRTRRSRSRTPAKRR